jgi:hypothetical protein
MQGEAFYHLSLVDRPATLSSSPSLLVAFVNIVNFVFSSSIVSFIF